MNAKHLWALEEFVEQSKAWILTANPRLSDIRSRAETELGFKCPDGPIRDCMTRHEIPVRRSKEEAEKQMMRERIESLEGLVLDMFAMQTCRRELWQVWVKGTERTCRIALQSISLNMLRIKKEPPCRWVTHGSRPSNGPALFWKPFPSSFLSTVDKAHQ